ncbi:MAG TPA: FG-GAP repeat protein [Acidimicrobiales bacterium]
MGPSAQVFRQGLAPVGGAAQRSDQFGAALAAGDLDGDGFDDLVVGAPTEDVDGARWAGTVTVLLGGPSGPGARVTTLRQGAGGLPGTPDGYDSFGAAVAVADLDGDGFDDLAISAPQEWSNGTVTVVPGGRGGLVGRDARSFDGGEVCGCSMAAMGFGESLAAGDLDGDGFADLVVGAPWWSPSAELSLTGNVTVLFGGEAGPDRAFVLDQSTLGFAREQGDTFGASLAVGPLDGDGADDLLVGSVREAVGDIGSAGVVVRVRGATDGFPGTATMWHQASLAGATEADDFFGDGITIGDFSGDGIGDAAIGAPGEDVGTVADAGNVTVVDTTGGAAPFNQGSLGGAVEVGDWFGSSLG